MDLFTSADDDALSTGAAIDTDVRWPHRLDRVEHIHEHAPDMGYATPRALMRAPVITMLLLAACYSSSTW